MFSYLEAFSLDILRCIHGLFDRIDAAVTTDGKHFEPTTQKPTASAQNHASVPCQRGRLSHVHALIKLSREARLPAASVPG